MNARIAERIAKRKQICKERIKNSFKIDNKNDIYCTDYLNVGEYRIVRNFINKDDIEKISKIYIEYDEKRCSEREEMFYAGYEWKCSRTYIENCKVVNPELKDIFCSECNQNKMSILS